MNRVTVAVMVTFVVLLMGSGIFAAASLVRFRTNIRDPKERLTSTVSRSID